MCEVTKNHRNRCQYCRLQKCLSMGMRSDCKDELLYLFYKLKIITLNIYYLTSSRFSINELFL